MRRRIIHYTNRGGRYGNQLVQFAHWIAYAAEHPGTEVAFLPYWPMAGLSQGTAANPYCIFPFDPARPPRPGPFLRTLHAAVAPLDPRKGMWLLDRTLSPLVGRRHARRLPTPILQPDAAAADPLPEIRLGDPAFTAALDRLGPTVFVAGYHFRDWELLRRHRDTVRDFLRPPDAAMERARQFLAPLRARHGTIVGVFVRQGDYRIWLNGRFFLTSERYATLLRGLQRRFADRDPCFVIASDAPQDSAAFAGLPHAFAPGRATGPGHYLDNVATLALCDSIVTVPSTSGVLPAFFGDVPIVPVAGPDADLETVPSLHDGMFDAVRDPVFSLSIN